MNPAALSNTTRFNPVLLAPFIFICHILEESPTFVAWFNSHVARGITAGSFWRVNITALMITIIVVAIEQFSHSDVSLSLAVAWLSLLMLANGVFHIVGAFVDKGYVPGVITAAVLYLPYSTWFLVKAFRSKRVSAVVLIVSAVIGAIPMTVHGYLILFKGDRLF